MNTISAEGTLKLLFISHSTTDKEIAKFLDSTIGEHRCQLGTFLSSKPGDIPTGQDWFTEIEDKLKTSDIYLVLLTPSSIKSTWVWFETGVAWSSGKQLVPVCAASLHKSEVPFPIAAKQLLNIESSDDMKQMFTCSPCIMFPGFAWKTP